MEQRRAVGGRQRGFGHLKTLQSLLTATQREKQEDDGGRRVLKHLRVDSKILLLSSIRMAVDYNIRT